MARIAGVDLPRDKSVEYALPEIFGIGLSNGRIILAQANVAAGTRVNDLTEAEIARLRDIIEREYRVEGDLKRQIQLNIRRLQEIGSYRGRRHRAGLPVRGQRTSTNARTRKGPKRTVGAKKKKK